MTEEWKNLIHPSIFDDPMLRAEEYEHMARVYAEVSRKYHDDTAFTMSLAYSKAAREEREN